jgi:hypothetical protein
LLPELDADGNDLVLREADEGQPDELEGGQVWVLCFNVRGFGEPM